VTPLLTRISVPSFRDCKICRKSFHCPLNASLEKLGKPGGCSERLRLGDCKNREMDFRRNALKMKIDPYFHGEAWIFSRFGI
jgi:hypothetical protein